MGFFKSIWNGAKKVGRSVGHVITHPGSIPHNPRDLANPVAGAVGNIVPGISRAISPLVNKFEGFAGHFTELAGNLTQGLGALSGQFQAFGLNLNQHNAAVDRELKELAHDQQKNAQALGVLATNETAMAQAQAQTFQVISAETKLIAASFRSTNVLRKRLAAGQAIISRGLTANNQELAKLNETSFNTELLIGAIFAAGMYTILFPRRQF